jgi:hypothetical protein
LDSGQISTPFAPAIFNSRFSVGPPSKTATNMSLSKISKLKARFQAVAVRQERLNQVGGSAYCLFLFLELRESWCVPVLEISAMTFLAIDSSES